MKKLISLLLIVFMVLTLGGCAKKEIESATGVGKGIHGEDVVVEVSADEEKIYSVVVTKHNETPGLGSVAAEEIPARIVESNSILVDSTAGATVTSDAIIVAVKEALTALGLDYKNFEKVITVEENTNKQDVTLECDVVVVGGGGAGLTASSLMAEQGKKVILLEKMSFVGGNSLKASGGMNAAGTHYQAEQAGEEAIDTATVEQFITDIMWGGRNKDTDELVNDLSLVTKMANESSNAIDWLDSINAPLPKLAATGGCDGRKYLHEPEDGSAVGQYLVNKLNEYGTKVGVDIMLNTTATEIIMNNGAAVGVKANDKNNNYTINAKAVIITTGGFGANFDMMAEYDPALRNAVTTNASGTMGDGINMAVAVGADTVDMEWIQLHPTVFQENGDLISEAMRSNGAILVNQDGKRFTNDLSTRDAVSQAELKQNPAYAFIIMDQKLVDESKKAQQLVDKNAGKAVYGETYEELAANMGMNETQTKNFVAQMAKWNEDCANGQVDTEFGRKGGMENGLGQAPYYAIKIAPGIHHTMGGIKINDNAEVVSTSGVTIPGLYAAGETTGGVHGANRIGGTAVCDFVVFGRIAAQSAMDYIK